MLISNDHQDSTQATEAGTSLHPYAQLHPSGVAEAAPGEITDDLIFVDDDEEDDLADLTDEDEYNEQVEQAKAAKKNRNYPTPIWSKVWAKSLGRIARGERSTLEQHLYLISKKVADHRLCLAKAKNGGELLRYSRKLTESIIAYNHYAKLVRIDNRERNRAFTPSHRPPAFLANRGKYAIKDGPPDPHFS